MPDLNPRPTRTASYRKVVWYLCLLVSLITVACAAEIPTPEQQAGSAIPLASCQLSAPGTDLRIPAKCGKLTVYEDRQAKSGPQIELNLAVLPAVSRTPAPDPIFYLAGGPGEAATESFLVIYSAFQRLNQKRDIVLVDQRGTGRSNRLDCPEISGAGDEITVSNETLSAALESCLNGLDADVRLYTTAIAMDDLDQVRDALGYDKINLYGASYGTRAALAYARQHPEHLRATILDGVAPPNWLLGPDLSEDAQRALDLIFTRCAADSSCGGAFPDLQTEFQSILATLRKEPVKFPIQDPTSGEEGEFTMTAEAFSSTIRSMSYQPETTAMLPLMIHAAFTQQDFSPLAAQSLITADLVRQSLSFGTHYTVICTEDAPFFENAPSSGYLGDFAIHELLKVCSTWPRGELPEDFRQPVQSEAPFLLISGEADPVTPPENAALAAQSLPDSLQLVVPGHGHVNIFRGCIPEVATAFIESGSRDSLDTSCVREIVPPPFFLNRNGPKP